MDDPSGRGGVQAQAAQGLTRIERLPSHNVAGTRNTDTAIVIHDLEEHKLKCLDVMRESRTSVH